VPRAGEWKATDFESEELEAWDRQDRAPFHVPSTDETGYGWQPTAAPSRGRERPSTLPGPGSTWPGVGRRPAADDWDEEDDAGWETGTWDTGWATDFQPSVAAPRDWDDDWGDGQWSREWRGYGAGYAEDDALEESLDSLALLGAAGATLGRVARVRMLVRRRPAAAAMLAFFLLGFMLTCMAPLIPLLRLGYDAADALHRVSTLQAIFKDGSAALFNTANLKDAQEQVDGITHDLYEINGAMNIMGAPLAAVSPQMRNYRLLTRMGFDLTASADEGLTVAQTLLTPLQGGAFSSSSPGITAANIQQARQVLDDAIVRVQDAVAAYHQLDVSALPGQLQPGTRYGKLLGLLPEAQGAMSEMNALLDIVPAMLGIGQPAYYLVIAMDRTELRPGGGFQGNFGYLVLDGGKQSKTHPLSLNDVYNLDGAYYRNNQVQNANVSCDFTGPQPPLYYWWWPYRNIPGCQYGWGLRDSNLSPDFPEDAQTAMTIARQAGFGDSSVPAGTQLQGVIAFTPVLIEELLQAAFPNGLAMPQYHITVTAQNLQHEIHQFQLGGEGGANQPRKTFTHELSSALLQQLKTLHGAALKPVLKVAQEALKDKDLEVYFSNPRAQLILQQLGLASMVSTGGTDGFFVVDTNDGGNKANTYVTEHQTDYVMLLPNGGALHRLQISVTYARPAHGNVYQAPGQAPDYSDLQRTYLPGDATILGYSGFAPPIFSPSGCYPGAPAFATFVTDCSSPLFAIPYGIATSDVPGRTMVLGPLLLSCGPAMPMTDTVETTADFNQWNSNNDVTGCDTQPITRSQNIYIEWYTPHAFTMDASGHGTYTELVEKQAGSADFLQGVGDYLTVYVDTSQLHASHPQVGQITIGGADPDGQFAALIKGHTPLINNQQIQSNVTVSYDF
jgi:hypothetical protein